MAKPLLAVGCGAYIAVDYPVLQKFDSAGNPYQHGHRIRFGSNVTGVLGIALDSIGNTHTASQLQYHLDADSLAAYGEYARTTRKHNANGELIWSVTHGADCFGCAIDDSGNLYTYGDAINSGGAIRSDPSQTTGYVTTRKYDSSGTLLWSADHGYAATNAVETYSRPIVYRDGYIYTGSIAFPYDAPLLTKTNASTGSVVWRTANSYNSHIQSIAVDASGNCYVAGIFNDVATPHCLRKYDSNGNLIAYAVAPTNSLGDRCAGRGVVIRSDGHVIVAMYPVNISGTYYVIHEYDSDCIYVNRDSGALYTWMTRGIAIDSDDGIYVTRSVPSGAGAGTAARTVSRVDGFSLTWQASTFGNDLEDVTGNAIDAACISLVNTVQTPPLRLPISLGLPAIIGDAYIHVPSLSLRFSLGTPTILRDYIGEPLPIVYRLVFPGSSPAISLLLKSVQVRADLVTTYATVSVALPDSTTLTALESRIAQSMEIHRGIRFGDGTEQLELFYAVTLNTISTDIGPSNSSLTLSGSANTVQVPKTRTIKNISYRNDYEGARRIRCDVDTLLRPGDTADLGNGETMLAGQVTVYATHLVSQMEVSE